MQEVFDDNKKPGSVYRYLHNNSNKWRNNIYICTSASRCLQDGGVNLVGDLRRQEYELISDTNR